MSIASLIAKTIAKRTGDIFDNKLVRETSQAAVAGLEEEINMNPDMEDYVDLVTASFFDEKIEMPIEQLQKEFGQFFNEKGFLQGGEEFSRARGYTEDEIAIFEAAGELATDLDPNQEILAKFQKVFNPLREQAVKFRANVPENVVLPKKAKPLVDYFAREMDLYEDLPQTENLSKKGLMKVARDFVIDAMNDEDTKDALELILRELPRERADLDPTEVLPPDMREQALETFLKGSQETQPIYRAVSSYNNLDYDIGFAMPREVGVHVGTSGQANTIAARAFLPEYSTEFTLPARGGEQVDTAEFGEFFEETAQEFLRPKTTSKPVTMLKGYIRVKNPLVLYTDMNNWDAGVILTEGGITDIVRAVESQGGKMSQELDDELGELIAFANYINEKPDPYKQGLYLDPFKRKIMRIELNKRFQTWLMKNGFDSIKYRNEVEPSLVNQADYSYILFKPQQFKSVNAKRFDPTVPRDTFAEGGYVIKSGDTLSQIAKDNNTTVAELARLNGIEDVNKIYAGQKLNLGQQVEEAMRPEPKKAPEKPQKAPKPEKEDEGFNLNVDFAKQFVRGFFKTGDQETEDFSDKLRSVLRDAARNANRKGQDYITYKEYPQLASGESADDWVKGRRSGSFLDKLRGVFTDPVLNAAVTVGQGNLVRENGRVYFTDEYDFTPIEKDYSELGAYGKVRKWAGENFPEDGNKIRIDLGPEEEIFGRPEVAMDQQDTDTQEV